MPVLPTRYIEAWQEMMDQGVLDNFDDVIVASGSGGTAAALAIANHLTGGKLKFHAVIIAEDRANCYRHLQENLDLLGIKEARPEDLVDVMDSYLGGKHGAMSRADVALIRDAGDASGIILDPVYTGKAYKGLVNELKTNRERFRGNRVLFIHTGGMFANYRCKEELDRAFDRLYIR